MVLWEYLIIFLGKVRENITISWELIRKKINNKRESVLKMDGWYGLDVVQQERSI